MGARLSGLRKATHFSRVKFESDQARGVPILEIKGHDTTGSPDRAYLEARGFRVEEASSYQDAAEHLKHQPCAAVLLDLWVAGDGGLETLRRIRPAFPCPIFVYAAEFESTDRILAYELGADDFLACDIAPREWVARIRAGIRRRRRSAQPDRQTDPFLLVQDLEINVQSRTVSQDGSPLRLTRAEFDVLATLMQQAGRVCSRERLLDAVAPDGQIVLDRTIDVHVAALRRKLHDPAKAPQYIRTVRGLGYAFIPS